MRTRAFIVATSLILVFPASAMAQPVRWHGHQGWGPAGAYAHLYDSAKVETIAGEIASVERITPMRGMSYGVQVVLKTTAETIPVHLGPGWFLENQDVKLAAGDRIEVKGARAMVQGMPVILAAQVTKGDDTLHLRDDAGVPAWAAWRRGPRP